MVRPLRILSLFTFLLTAITGLYAQQAPPVEMASLRPSQQLRLQRISPTAQQPDGPVLYQLVFTPGTTGTIAKFDSNTRHLVDSDITDLGHIVNIGGLMINGGSGIVTFVGGQTLPAVQLNGVVNIVNGGTGLNSTGAAGNYLRSSGSAWTSSAIQSGDLPSLSGSYVDLTTVQSVGGIKTFNDTISANGAVASGTGHPGGQFTGGFTIGNNVTGGAGVMGTGGDNQGPNETAGPGVVGHGGNNTVGIASSSVAGDGGQFTGGNVFEGPGTGGNGILARAGGSGGNIMIGLDSTGSQAFAVGGNGDVTLRGRISLGIYIKTDAPTSGVWDESCSNVNDVAVAGGAFVLGASVFLRESRPTTNLAPGQTGAPSNAWRVTCSNGSADVNCTQAYVVCLSHAKP